MKSSGTPFEKRSMAVMAERGYACERALAKVIWIKGRPISIHHDFWGCIDLVCISKKDVKLIQVRMLDGGHGWLAETRRMLAVLNAPPGSVLLHVWGKNEKGRWELKEETIGGD